MTDEASDAGWVGPGGVPAGSAMDPDLRVRRAEQLADFAGALARCGPDARAVSEAAARHVERYLGLPCGVAQVRDGGVRMRAVAAPDASSANALHASLLRRPMAAHRSRDGCAARHEGAGAPVRIVSSTGADGAGAALVLPLAGAGWDLDDEARRFVARLADHVALALGNARRFEEAQARNEALAEQARALTEAVGQIEGFAWSAAHDLRAPLRTIEGLASELVDDYAAALPSDAQALLGHVYRNVERMAALVDDLLVLAQVSRAPLRRAWVDLGALVAEVVEDLTGLGGGAARWPARRPCACGGIRASCASCCRTWWATP